MVMNRCKFKCRVAALATAAALAWGTLQAPAQAQGGDVVIFAAASLTDALDAINAEWQKETGKKATISYAASSVLAKQIEQDAPAQIFISADLVFSPGPMLIAFRPASSLRRHSKSSASG